jgi:hypothetical protein
VLYSVDTILQCRGIRVTVDEELTLLEDHMRRLKIEYDVFFNGGAKRAPNELEWKVQATLKKYSDGGPTRMNFGQRFRYNALAQKYAVFSDLWRQKRQIKEEGYRRPQDAILSIAGLRTVDDEPTPKQPQQHVISRMIAQAEPDSASVGELYNTMMEARSKAGIPPSGSLEGFRAFVSLKTAQIRSEYGCQSVEYTVEVDGNKVLLKAKARS